ncbi:MAG TPA: molybdopterin-dependent oxidoreductase [Clostridia bacterium]|nr:molybdopterin-dependent oxidoreductase [Clostridia bacterium]
MEGDLQRNIGKRMPRIDVLSQVTGKALYGEDLTRPGMLYGVALRSKYAHAKIPQIDTQAAEKVEGVLAIITAKDIPNNIFGFTHLDQPVLAEKKVRYLGEPLAVVAASSPEKAREAVRLIKVDYQPLPGVFQAKKALAEDAPKIHDKGNLASHVKIRSGCVEEGLKHSTLIIEDEFSSPYIEHAHIEPHVALAEVDRDGKLVIWTSTSRPFAYLTHLCKVLQMPSHRLKIIVPSVGGSFGGKNEISLEPWVALLAMKTGRPVKMVFTRQEEFTGSSVRHPYQMRYVTGVSSEGMLLARKIEVYSNTGAYVQLGEETLKRACISGCGPYYIPHIEIDGYLVYTNGPVGGAMRGFGVSQVAFAHEVHMERICRELGMDSFEFRSKNALKNGDPLPTGQLIIRPSIKETILRAREICSSY